MSSKRMAKNRSIFAEKITDEFINRITGRNIDRLVGKNPEKSFFVGKLYYKDEQSAHSSKRNIANIGVDFILKKEDLKSAKLVIKPSGNFYYRVLPTYDEQFNLILREINVNANIKIETYKELVKYLNDYPESRNFLSSTKLESVYQKLDIYKEDFFQSFELKNLFNENDKYGKVSFKSSLQTSLNKNIDEVVDFVDTYKNIRDFPGLSDLENEETFKEFLVRSNNSEAPRPNWELDIVISAKKISNDLYRINVDLINETVKLERVRERNNYFSQVLFDCGLSIQLQNATFQPIELKYFQENYKYDRYQYAIGNQCSIEFNKSENIIKTITVPIYKQKRLKTVDKLKVTFRELIDHPYEILENIYESMLEEKSKWINYLDVEIPKKFSHLEDITNVKESLREEIDNFDIEINRFKNGLDQIKLNDLVKQSFVAMNETFIQNKKYDSWRLFQIVFIVSMIPDIIASHYGEDEIPNALESVDLLYFPTGGGKTEAFLGVTVFTLFFDRYRGKSAGVSAMIKYPLRLLSVQQVDRLMATLAWAEEVRIKKQDLFDGERFSVGYYVGDSNTPNKIDKEKFNAIRSYSREDLNEKYRIIDICPFCNTKTVNIVFDEDLWRLKHVCSNKDCLSDDSLPVYIIDHEIYRYLPSVVVSTIDKVAFIGLNSNFRNILGEVKAKCPKHGYTSKNYCVEKTLCDTVKNKLKPIELNYAAPTLLIQDEIHLIRESLGTFDAHYETFIDYYVNHLGKHKSKMKVIGATATVSEYKSQLMELYCKDSSRFPCESPYLTKDFYSEVDEKDLHRIIIGFAPYGLAMMNSMVYAMKYMRQIVYSYYKNQELFEAIEGIEIEDDKEILEILQDYWVFIEYNNVKLDATDVQNALDGIINAELRNENIPPFNARSMTGDDHFQDVRKVLFDLDSEKDIESGVNLITATNMISHGVDTSRFNTIFFFGMPKNTAEYIQAYSRVGRMHTGIVIDIIRPTREKDMSYLKNFKKFHEFKDILVDPVPINRWANKAIHYTLPGILSGMFINHYDNYLGSQYGDLYNVIKLKNVIEHNLIDKEEFIDHLLKAYKCIDNDNTPNDVSNKYQCYIRNIVDQLFKDFPDTVFSTKGTYITGNLQKVVPELERVMNSLRDTEKNVNIEMR